MFGVGFLPYPSVFDKTFSTHYFNGGKQEKMKKRLLSMLMAVLMIASLVPATALAAPADCDHADGVVISIKKDAAAKQPGIEVVICKDCNTQTVEVTKFAKDRDTCKECKNPVTKEIVAASCELPGLTITYCADCGQLYGNDAVEWTRALGHNYDTFKVVKAPTCQADGWGYALCKNCGEPVFINSEDMAADLINRDNFKTSKEYLARVAEVALMFAATNVDHANKDALVAVTKETELEDGTVLKPAVKAFHAATVTEKDTGRVIYVNKDKDGNVIDGTGYTGDYVCPHCDYVLPGAEDEALNSAHAAKMAIVAYGELPGVDEDGEPYDGKTDTIKCGVCGVTYGGEKIPYVSAYPMTKDAVKATCTTKGYTGDVYKLDAKGNEYVAEKGTEIPALGHKWVAVEGKDATCTEPGYTYTNYFKCANKGCDAHKGDAASIITIPAGHKYVRETYLEPTCKNQGLVVIACTVCGDVQNVYYASKVACVAADELANVKAATCTEDGYTGDSVCKWCGKVLKAGEVVKAAGHTPEEVAAVAATCTETGLTAGSKCSVCGEVLTAQEVVPALGHKFENGVCTVCGEKDPNYVPPVVNPFKDVEKSSPYYDAIIWAADKGVTTGKTADTFGINDGCTRAQIVTFLYRAAGSPAVKADTVNPFTDVSKDSVYYNAILWAVENGITKGTTETTFDPNAVCTRGQIVTFLFRASGDEKVATGTNFADVASGSYCADAVAWAVANKVANGFADGTFRPEATCTRGQAVTFIYRALAE